VGLAMAMDQDKALVKVLDPLAALIPAAGLPATTPATQAQAVVAISSPATTAVATQAPVAAVAVAPTTAAPQTPLQARDKALVGLAMAMDQDKALVKVLDPLAALIPAAGLPATQAQAQAQAVVAISSPATTAVATQAPVAAVAVAVVRILRDLIHQALTPGDSIRQAQIHPQITRPDRTRLGIVRLAQGRANPPRPRHPQLHHRSLSRRWRLNPIC
jgi:hypothetical protein